MHRVDWIRNRCKHAGTVLDIGCAESPLFPGWDNVTRIDLNEYDHPNFIKMDAHDLKFDDKSFDIAVLGEILEHVEDPVRVLQEASRVARQVIITVPNPAEWKPEYRPYETIEGAVERTRFNIKDLAQKSNIGAKTIHGDTTGDYSYIFHNRWYTEATLNDDLKKAGLKDYKVSKLNYDGWSFFRVEAPHIFRIALLSTPYMTTPPEHYGGLERVVADLACGLSELGHDVTVFAANGSKPLGNYRVVECIKPLESFADGFADANWYEYEKKMYYACREQLKDFDIVHGHNWFCFESLLGRPVVHTHHGALSWQSFPPNCKFVAISKWMQSYSDRYFGAEVASYVYNGVDMDAYKYEKKKGNRLLFVGRFAPMKQTHVAIEVAKKTGLGIDLVGSVHDKAYFDQMMSDAGDHDVVIHEEISHKDKIRLLQNAKCLLFPSAMGEPFGLVAIEALACGTPVIASMDGAIPELITPGVGRVCGSVDDMVDAVHDINHIKPADCRKRAEQFSRRIMAENYLKIYEGVTT